jgi:small GTP-binding protein
MSFSVGIVGLPNVGKSTLFKVLTKREVKISPRPFTTIEPNFGHVSLPDERLSKIASLVKPEKITPTTIEFVDIAGLVKGAHKGEGLGNQFLSHIRDCDSILMVIRAFEDPKVENVLGEINPQKEIEILRVELLMKDLETIEKAISKLEKKKDKKDLKKIEILKKIKEIISQGKMISEIELGEEEKKEIKEYQFLTGKPSFCVLNINGKTKFQEPNLPNLKMNLKEEEEFLEFSEKEKKELGFESKIDEVIKECYKTLNLITFYTIAGGKEARAWTTKEGTFAPEAGGIVHSDFEKKFIKAEVINWNDLVKTGSWQKAKEIGLIKIVGRDYILKDGDVIEFRI